MPPRTDQLLSRTPPPPAPERLAALRALGGLELPVRGRSMLPLVADGARVWIVPLRRLPWPGDVVAFSGKDRRLVLHRVLGPIPHRGRLALLTQGDAAERPDPPVPPGRVLGRLAGGRCAPEAVRIPWQHRLRALGRYLGLVGRHLRPGRRA